MIVAPTEPSATARPAARSSPPRVVRLSLAVVKSTRLQPTSRLVLTERGAADDRRFFVVDADGRLQTARKVGALLEVRASLDPEGEELTLGFPDGSAVRGPIRRGPAVPASFGEDPVPAVAVLGPFDQALTDHLGVALRLVESLEPGAVQDAEPLTLISTASIRELARLGGRREAIDPRRFRMNLEIGGCEPFEEDGWRGRRLAIGTSVVDVGDRVGRCVVTTLDPETGDRSLDTLRLIARRGLPRDEGLPLGVYLRVVRPGTVTRGDEVRPADDRAGAGA